MGSQSAAHWVRAKKPRLALWKLSWPYVSKKSARRAMRERGCGRVQREGTNCAVGERSLP